ncbi:tetratricopeptide repeat protein [Nocardioides zeicaulis]|uniref:Tetratricopeptide repeat protein n=1 Tax=Nocardioides zeicaulis TaxID=1776857 RepID=A0ABV6E0B8_9ACTN
MDDAVVSALGTGLSVTTFLVGFASIRLRGQRDRAITQSDGVLRDLVRASSDGRALSDDEVEQSTGGFVEAKAIDPVAKGAVWFYWFVASSMLCLCAIGGVKSGAEFTPVVADWTVDSYVVGFLMLLQLGVCGAGTADYLFVRRDLDVRLRESTLGIVERAIAARNAPDYDEAHRLADDLIRRLPSWPWAYAFRGHVRMSLGRKEAALEDFDKALMLRSDDPVARLARAEHRLAAGDAAGALEDLGELPPERHREHAVLKLKGSALYKLGRRDEAVVIFDQVVRRNPDDPEARVRRGEALAESDSRSAAHRRGSIAALEVLVMEEGERVALTALSQVGRDNLSRRNVKMAIQDFSFALAQAPTDRRLLRLRGDAYIRNGDLEAGERDFEKALSGADDKERAIGLRQRGRARERAGDNAGALADFTASIEVLPTHQALFYRALHHERFERTVEALEDVEGAVSLAPDDDDYLSHRAALLAAGGEVGESEAAFRDVELRFPANSHNYSLWLGTMLRRGAIIDGLGLAARAVAACPEDAGVRLMAARIKSENGQYERALADVDAARELGADEAQADYVAARILADAGRLDEAEASVARAAAAPSDYQHVALMTRYVVRRRRGDLSGAIADVSRAIEITPGASELFVRRACARLALTGANTDALDDIEEALKLNPGSSSALNHLSEYYLTIGDANKAVAAAENAIAHSGSGRSKRLLASSYFLARRWAEAIDLLAELVRTNPSDDDSLWSLAAAYSNSGRFVEAEATFAALVQLDNSNLDARAGLAVSVSQQHRSRDAVSHFRTLKADFGLASQEWIDKRLHPDLLPEYSVVMNDWETALMPPDAVEDQAADPPRAT